MQFIGHSETPRHRERDVRKRCGCLSGNQRKRQSRRATKSFTEGRFQTYSWGYGSSAFTNKHCGVAIWLNKKVFSWQAVKKILPVPAALQGRCAASMVKNWAGRFLIFVAFFPVRPEAARMTVYAKTLEAIYKWLCSLAAVPRRFERVGMLDLNDGLGMRQGQQ